MKKIYRAGFVGFCTIKPNMVKIEKISKFINFLKIVSVSLSVYSPQVYQGFNTINLNSKKWLILMNQESDFLWPSLTLRAQYYEGFQKNLSRGITAHFTTQFNVGSWWLTSWQNPSTTYFKTSRKNLSKHCTIIGKLGKKHCTVISKLGKKNLVESRHISPCNLTWAAGQIDKLTKSVYDPF